MFASDTEKSSSQSVPDDSSVQNSNIVQSVEDDESENVISVEIAEPRRSGRERKQTALYGNPLLYTITCKLTPRFVPVFLIKMSETLESLHTNYLMDSKSDDSSSYIFVVHIFPFSWNLKTNSFSGGECI